MNSKDFFSLNSLQQKWLSRRNLIRGAAGTAAGAGLFLGSGLQLPALADDEDEEHGHRCEAVPRPVPHISTPVITKNSVSRRRAKYRASQKR